MNKLHWKKGIACGGMFLALLGLTFYILLSDQDPGKLWTALGQAEWSWLAVGAACMMLFFCCEAKNIQTGLGLIGSPAPYASCLLYAITGFFFSSVTPSASGGQPMQLYAMYRDGHAPAPGALALLTDFFSFQLAAVFWASVGFFLHHAQLIRLGNGVWLCFAFGAVLNLLVVVALCGAVFSPRALPTLWGWLMRPARRLFPSAQKAGDAGEKSSGRICGNVPGVTVPINGSWVRCFSPLLYSWQLTTVFRSGFTWLLGCRDSLFGRWLGCRAFCFSRCPPCPCLARLVSQREGFSCYIKQSSREPFSPAPCC